MTLNKILFINYGLDIGKFEEYVDDFIEDLGSISDKYEFKKLVGRPREWKRDLTKVEKYGDNFSIKKLIESTYLDDELKKGTVSY